MSRSTDRQPPIISPEQQVFELVNLYRQSLGLDPLRWEAQLATMAREHSRAMAEGRHPFSHAGLPERAEHASRNKPLYELGENLLWVRPGSLSAWRAFYGWWESPDHRAAMEGCYNRSAVGVATGADGTMYYTQFFALRPARNGARPRCPAEHRVEEDGTADILPRRPPAATHAIPPLNPDVGESPDTVSGQ